MGLQAVLIKVELTLYVDKLNFVMVTKGDV
jgi:hypothetical protein